MIVLNKHTKWFKRKTSVKIADSWSDLLPEQYIEIVRLIHLFIATKISLMHFRLYVLQALSGYKRSKKRYKLEQIETINSNLAILAGMLTFPVRPRYTNPEYLEVLSEGLRQKLKIYFPEEIYEAEYINELLMVKDKLKYEPRVNLDFRCNPLQYITFKKSKLSGPVFNIDKNGVVQTDMIALEFVDASQFADLYYQTKDENYLNNLISVLYRKNRKEYSTHEAQIKAEKLTNLPFYTKFGVLLFFQSVVYYLSKHSQFGILYDRPSETENKQPKLDLGVGNVMAQLTKDGFGTRYEIEHLPLGDYFLLLLKQIVDAVTSMRDAKIKDFDIAKKLHITLQTVQKI